MIEWTEMGGSHRAYVGDIEIIITRSDTVWRGEKNPFARIAFCIGVHDMTFPGHWDTDDDAKQFAYDFLEAMFTSRIEVKDAESVMPRILMECWQKTQLEALHA
jgi:hypothetical protein